MFKELLKKIAECLSDNGISYMIIGGQAVILYGEPRLTKDIDITLDLGVDGLPGILRLLKNIPLEPIPEDVSSFVERTMVLPTVDPNTGIRVDFIFSFTPYEKEAISRIRQVSIDTINIHFASPEDVIILKLFAQRSRDLEDARIILLKMPDIDNNYIEKWLAEFDKSFPELKLLRLFHDLLKDS